MSFGNYLELTDPKVMRALAHPVRMAILSHLHEAGPATATECAKVTEESPSACSYHLRRLAELGFVEQTPSGDGRERRWRLLISGYGIPKEAQDRPEILAAMRPLTRRWIEDAQRVVAEYMRREPRFEPAWRKAATFQQTNPTVTPEELIRIGEQIQELFAPYQERQEHPEGAERVHVSFVAVPWPPKRRSGRRPKTRRSTHRGKR